MVEFYFDKLSFVNSMNSKELTLTPNFFLLRSWLDRQKLSPRQHERLRECRMDWYIAEKIPLTTCSLETDGISFILVYDTKCSLAG